MTVEKIASQESWGIRVERGWKRGFRLGRGFRGWLGLVAFPLGPGSGLRARALVRAVAVVRKLANRLPAPSEARRLADVSRVTQIDLAPNRGVWAAL